ncbi:MAG: NAD(P)H-dependent oxidoreductase [Candidatus Saccharibacteria bacterium]|nr:NAD(P)H-dependent oxidoreductase [Candidatus Saccharibacteria bacterium]
MAIKIQIILGSTRPNRRGESVTQWVYELAKTRDDIEAELVDIKDYNLPLLDEPEPAGSKNYVHEHTKHWSAKINEADGYVFVTPEYNHSVPSAMKNAVDFLYSEWNNKAVGFVSYGGVGGVRSVEHWRSIAGQLQMADVRGQVTLMNRDDFDELQVQPKDHHERAAHAMLDQLSSWASALKPLRNK